ncbi:MAG: PAS domain S-box protein, partial [Verrucomicrobia bacterium]|nr:PAS domain S-box protein [Verrucomicrobiota bacterium]
LDLPLPEIEAWYKYVKREGGTIYAESFIPRLRGGQGAHLWGAAAPLYDPAGRPCGAIEVIRDVTEQKRVENALHESHSFLEKAQEVAHLGSWSSSLSAEQSLVWSSEIYRIFGLTEGEFDGKVASFYALVHPEDRDDVYQTSRQAIAQGAAYDTEHRIVRPDGTVRWVHEKAEVVRDPSGQPIRLVGIVQDITERRRAEEARRESERKYRELVEHANSIILRWARDGRILFLNEFGQRFFGYTEAEICGRHVMGTLVPETESGGRDLSSLMDEICADPAA